MSLTRISGHIPAKLQTVWFDGEKCPQTSHCLQNIGTLKVHFAKTTKRVEL